MERPPRSPTSPSQRLAVEVIRSPVQRSVPETSTDSPNRRSSRKLRKETNDNDSQNKRPKDKSRDKQKSKTDESNEKKIKSSVKSERSGRSKGDSRVDPGSSTTVALDDSEQGWAQGILPDQQPPASPSSSKKSGRRNPSTRSSRINSRSPSPRPFRISNDQSPSPRQSRISNDTSRSPRPSRISSNISPSPRPPKIGDRSGSPTPSNIHRRNTSPSPSRRKNADFNASSLSLDDGESDVGGESEDDWRGEFADSVGPQTGIPYILDNGLPSVPVLAKGENAKFHDCIKNHNWEKLEKLLRNFDANYYKKKRLQVRERREQELLRLEQAEEEAKAADEKAAAEAKELGIEGENTKTTPLSRRFFPPFSRKSPGNLNKPKRPQNETPGSNGGLASKLLPKSLAARLIIDPEEVLSPLLMVDEMERTPLHLACIHKAPETALLDLLTAERKAAMVKDENGQVPLHCAIETLQFDHVIEKIIRAFPHALKTKDESGKTPIGLAVKLALERQQKESNEDPERPFLWIHPTCKKEESWQYQQEKIWGKVNLLLKGLMKRNKVVIPSEHSLILEALIGGANPNTINRFVSTADRYLVLDDELAGTAIGLCVERHYSLDTIEYVVDNCREKTTIITDAITKALRAHYRLGCYAIREGMTPFGKQIIEWSKSSHPLREDNPILERSPKIESLEKGKPGSTRKMSRRFFGADVDNGENGNADDVAKAEWNPSGEDEKHKVDQWHGMDEPCKQWWEILNYLIFYCAYGRGYKESLKPKSHHLLHAALSISVSPPSLIQLLLIVYPEATKEPCPLYGALPMHIACTRWRYDIIRNDGDSSLDRVLKLMLKSDPDVVHHRHRGRLPIHLALSVGQTWSFVKTFVAMDKKCVGMRDPHSRFFPFQMAALPMTSKNVQLLMRSQFTPTEWRIMSTGEKKLKYRKVEIDQDRKQVGTIFELLRHHPDALVGKPLYRGDGPPSTALRVTGKVSMTYLSYVYGRNSEGEYRLRADNVRILRDAIVRADIPLDMENWWEKMKESIWEEYHGDIPRNDQHLLHAALYNPESPPLLIELLLVIFPFSVSSAVAGTATYPLHIAAATTAYHRHSFELPYGMDNLHLVLSADKRIARRRSNGRLPLHIALARGKSWKEVRPLVMADPSSLMSEDPQTGLLPFQLIASFNVTSKENAMRFSTFVERQTRSIDMNRLSAKDKALALNRIRKAQELSQLTCIFELLRHRPSAMHRIPPGHAISEAGSVFSSSSYTLGSRGSDSHTGGAAARVGEFLSDSSQVNNRSSSIRGLFSPIPLSSRSMVPTYKDDESTKSLVSPSETFSRQSVVANSLSGATVHSNRSLSSKDGSDIFGGYTKNNYDDDSASSIVGTSFHSIDASTHSSPGLLKRGNYRRGKRPPRMPPKVPDLDEEG